MKCVTTRQMKRLEETAEKRFGIPTLLLMENAGRSVAEEAIRFKPRARTALVVCGPGNNGGDGLVAARHLALLGVETKIAFYGSDDGLSPDSGLNLTIVRKMRLPLLRRPSPGRLKNLAREANVIIDALFGTGLSRDLSGDYRAAIEVLNKESRKIISVDLPSGMDADTGKARGAVVRPALTLALGIPKIGFYRAARARGMRWKAVRISLPD